ncbi:MAG: FtsW/RodA/SpoVE family cell cycle protein [Chthonomonadales bacterium]|nr:FtsW/RodA/SpoVE family cell cycle protein [Chthonomonadales bacterium]
MALVLVVIACLLATLASVPLVVPSDVVNLNTVSSERLANDLEMDIALADAVIVERERLGAFSSVEQALATPVIARAKRPKAKTALAAIDWQEGSAEVLATALEIPRVLAERLIADRSARPGGRFASADQVLTASVFDASTAEPLRTRLVVRTPGMALGSLLLWAGLGCVALAGLLVVQRRLVPTADPWLVPLAVIPAGLWLAISIARGDPLRDTLPVAHASFGMWLGCLAFAGASWWLTRSAREGSVDHAPSAMDTVCWAVLVLWVVLCLAAAAGSRIGAPGIRWFAPALLVWGVSLLIRRHAGLGPDRLRAPAFGRVRPLHRAGSRTEIAWGLAPIVSMTIAFTVTRDVGVAVATGLSICGLLYGTNLRSASIAGLALCGLGVAGMSHLSPSAAAALATLRAPWDTHGHGVPATAASLWALASGGAWGTGLGLAPEAARTGAPFLASLGEQLGVPGLALVLLCAVLLAWRGSRMAVLGRHDGHRLLGVGAFSVLASFVVLGAGSSLALVPDWGVPLPLAADSRVLQILWFAMLGILVSSSSRLGPVGTGVERTELRRRLQELTVGLALIVLVGGTIRAYYIAAFAADRLAARSVRIASRQSGGEIQNPRLVAMAANIERGSILDTDGRLLATSRLREISEFHTGDGALARRYFRAGRYYPLGPAGAPVVGLWTRREGAQSGVERALDAHLRGYRRVSDLLPLYRTKDLPGPMRHRPMRGGDVVLTINGVLQEDAYRLLARAAKDHANGRPTKATLVVLSALTGQPIVAASVPSLDPNRIILRSAGGSSLSSPMLSVPDLANAVLPAPPGPFKIAAALAADQTGRSFETMCSHTEVGLQWQDGGGTRTMDVLQDDPLDPPHRRIGMQRATRNSCNIWFGRFAISIGAQTAYDRLAAILGTSAMPPRNVFGERLPAMFAGLDGAMVTPMQMAGVVASLMVGEAPVRPSYWRELRYADGRPAELAALPAASPDAAPVDLETAEMVRRVLAESVSGGPAAEVFAPLRVTVAGKAASVTVTGAPNRTDAWFVGFAPVKTPAFTFACWIENGGSGTRTAAPVVRDMLREMVGQ